MERKKIVIVESPSKIKNIGSYLGKDFVVIASAGHIRQLKRKPGSVVFNKKFKFDWELDDSKANNILTNVKKTDPDEIILAMDWDREGAAIAHSIFELLRDNGIKTPITRMVFNEITQEAILDALKIRTSDLNDSLVNSYLVRVGLDYLIGFTLSPILWKFLTCFKESSAGRVQSPTLFQIVARERERNDFRSQVSYSVSTNLRNPAGELLETKLFSIDGKKSEIIKKREDAEAIVQSDKLAGVFKVTDVSVKNVKVQPAEPFITSTLQQECSNKLGMLVASCMRVAQDLYENGLITYMRTDSYIISDSFMKILRDYIQKTHKGYTTDKIRVFKKEIKNAQEAHECIRPTDIGRLRSSRDFDALTEDHRVVYDLIRTRTLACQMQEATREQNVVILSNGFYELKYNYSRMVNPGFRMLYGDTVGPELKLKNGDKFDFEKSELVEHETEPPARFSEASIIKTMQEIGIGRPSTYASTVDNLKKKDLVSMNKKAMVPTAKGEFIALFLKKFLPTYIDDQFTAGMEEKLDEVARGECDVTETLGQFLKELEKNSQQVLSLEKSQALKGLEEMFGEMKCESCEGKMSLGIRFTPYWSCSTCKTVKKLSGKGDEIDLSDDKFEQFSKSGYRMVKYSGKEIFVPSFMQMELNIDIVRFLFTLPKSYAYKGSNVVFGYSKRGFYASYKRQFYNCVFDDVYALKTEGDCEKLMDKLLIN